jgi:hypothetical protein
VAGRSLRHELEDVGLALFDDGDQHLDLLGHRRERMNALGRPEQIEQHDG